MRRYHRQRSMGSHDRHLRGFAHCVSMCMLYANQVEAEVTSYISNLQQVEIETEIAGKYSSK